MSQKLIVTADSVLKSVPSQSGDLEKLNIIGSMCAVRKGDEFDVVAAIAYEGAPGADDDHLFIELRKPPAPEFDQKRWFVYAQHAQIEGNEPGNDPKDKPVPDLPKLSDVGPTAKVPGISAPVGAYQPIYVENGKPSNFTWGELTKHLRRIPENATVTGRIVKLARELDWIRSHLGNKPIHITSGYRDPRSNRYVGGALDSRHMYGDAVDFWVEGMDVVDVFYKLKSCGKRFGGLAVGNGFVHIDFRPGAPARWTYPGGPRVSLW